jgi:DNA polymerase-1
MERNAKNKKIPEERKEKVNWNSPEQVLWAFDAVANIKLESTGKEVLPEVDHPMAVALIEYRKALDVYKRFRETPVFNGRVYARWNQLKAKTGRMSCEKPPLQGIPKPLRRAFVAPDGYKLVVSDLSQIEIRVLAVLCGDENLREDLAAGRDVHRRAAASVFGKDYDDVTDDERKLAKGLVFGTLYGMGLKGFTARVNAWTGKKYTQKQVDKNFRKPLFAPYPKVQRWMDKTLSDYEDSQRVAYTRLGRRRLQLASGPEALNTPVQAGAWDVMKAIAAAAYEGREDAWKIVGLVHDEILLEVPDNQVERATGWLDGIMRTVGEETTNIGVPASNRVMVEAGTKACDSWAEKE